MRKEVDEPPTCFSALVIVSSLNLSTSPSILPRLYKVALPSPLVGVSHGRAPPRVSSVSLKRQPNPEHPITFKSSF